MSKAKVLQPNRKPTLKQQKTMEYLVENHGNVSKSMRQAGYSAVTAKNPKNFTQSDYVQALFEEVGLSDIDGIKQLKEGLNANKTIVMGDKEDSFVDIQPDHPTRHKYLETMLRIRGIGKQTDGSTTNFNFINVSRDDKSDYGI